MNDEQFMTINIILYCKKWHDTVAFYRDQLKLPILFSAKWFVEFGLNKTTRISVADDNRSSIKSCDGMGVTLALEVDDIEPVRNSLDLAGLKPTPIQEHPWNALVFYVFDPEGHRIEIWESAGK